MRWAALAVSLLLVGLTIGATATAQPRGKQSQRVAKKCAKKGKRCARVRHRVRRASQDRLVNAPRPGAPAPRPGAPKPPAPDSPPLPTFVSVAAREFSLTLSRPLVGAGDVRVELRNLGEDPHNLVVSPDGTSTPLSVFSELDPGEYERRTVDLSPGRYKLWCSLESHEGLGMKFTVRVQ
jgi:plastocyanin